jgi:ABC transporter DrrB family efflux protein
MRILSGLPAVIYKELIQVRRDPSTRVVFLIPIIQLVVFGYAIETDVRHIKTVVFDGDQTSTSREILQRFETTDVFLIHERASHVAQVHDAIVAGRAQVGLVIPPGFSDNLLNRRSAELEVLIDGSNNSIATQALNVANGLALQSSLERLGVGSNGGLPIDLRPRILFNEEVESARFFVPGLVGVILQLTTVFLTAFSLVRERERGTMEQLMVTPVSRWAVMLGKIAPYAVIGFLVTTMILVIMVYVFDVRIQGSLALLLSFSVLFLLPSLGLGVLISTFSQNQAQAMQFSFLVMLPSILLSGFVFPREEMPMVIYWMSFLFPATYYIEILRGIILRGAAARHLWQPAVMLVVFGALIFVVSALRFQKRIN